LLEAGLGRGTWSSGHPAETKKRWTTRLVSALKGGLIYPKHDRTIVSIVADTLTRRSYHQPLMDGIPQDIVLAHSTFTALPLSESINPCAIRSNEQGASLTSTIVHCSLHSGLTGERQGRSVFSSYLRMESFSHFGNHSQIF
jgi:hypothetical protein